MSLLHSSYLTFLRTTDHTQQLDFLPQDLTIWEIFLTILVHIFHQLLHILGFGRQIKQKPGSFDKDEHILPDLHLSMPFRVRQIDIRGYKHALHMQHHTTLLTDPAQICLLLSALSEPAMLLLLGHRACPVRPLGSVNVRNKFELHDTNLCTEQSLLGMTFCEVRARTLSKTRRVKRGLEVDFQVDIVDLSAGAATLLFRQVFTILQFIKFKNNPIVASSHSDVSAIDGSSWEGSGNIVDFQVNANDPKAWARICKDYNPIHVSRLAAKLFGFADVIAYGNHVLALALSRCRIEGQDKVYTKSTKTLVVEVEFKRPIVLSARKTLQLKSTTASEESERFCVLDHGKISIVASISRLMKEEISNTSIRH